MSLKSITKGAHFSKCKKINAKHMYIVYISANMYILLTLLQTRSPLMTTINIFVLKTYNVITYIKTSIYTILHYLFSLIISLYTLLYIISKSNIIYSINARIPKIKRLLVLSA